jgi:hypothetical protein
MPENSWLRDYGNWQSRIRNPSPTRKPPPRLANDIVSHHELYEPVLRRFRSSKPGRCPGCYVWPLSQCEVFGLRNRSLRGAY